MRAALILLLFVGGCTTVVPGNGARSGVHFGVTTVRVPQIHGNVAAASVRALGIGWDNGPYFGWRAGSWIVADPVDCHLLVVIRAAVETANAVQIINALEGQDPCIVDYTDTLRR